MDVGGDSPPPLLLIWLLMLSHLPPLFPSLLYLILDIILLAYYLNHHSLKRDMVPYTALTGLDSSTVEKKKGGERARMKLVDKSCTVGMVWYNTEYRKYAQHCIVCTKYCKLKLATLLALKRALLWRRGIAAE